MENQIIDVKQHADKEEDQLSPKERKAQYIRQGEIYRVGVVRAKAQVLHDAQPKELFYSAVDHASYAIRSRIDTVLRPTGFSVGALLPYAMPLVRLLRNRQFGTKGKLALGAVALLAGAGIYYQQKNKRDGAY